MFEDVEARLLAIVAWTVAIAEAEAGGIASGNVTFWRGATALDHLQQQKMVGKEAIAFGMSPAYTDRISASQQMMMQLNTQLEQQGSEELSLSRGRCTTWRWPQNIF